LFDERRKTSMLKFTDEVLARAFLLGCLGRGPTSRSDVLRQAESHALADFIPEAKAGLNITEYVHLGEVVWALPPNVVGFFPPARPHAHRLTGAHGGGTAA
jgi:hypothetical protein